MIWMQEQQFNQQNKSNLRLASERECNLCSKLRFFDYFPKFLMEIGVNIPFKYTSHFIMQE
jgi:hypothetical protein